MKITEQAKNILTVVVSAVGGAILAVLAVFGVAAIREKQIRFVPKNLEVKSPVSPEVGKNHPKKKIVTKQKKNHP